MTSKFDHRITEARPAILDSEGFWKYHDWVGTHQVWKLNDAIEKGLARRIETAGLETIITFGGGFHYDVEAVERCAVCGVQVSFLETAEDAPTCHGDRNEALAELDAGW